VKVLSKEHGDNYGIRANGPNYPASCINTMLEDSEYDVFILEYYMVQETGMMTLAHRLRERFPDAIIIIFRNWYPFMLHDSGYKIDKFRADRGFGRNFIHDLEFHKAFLEYGKEKWKFRHINWPDKIQYQENVARDVGAYISLMPFTEEAEGPDGYLEIGRKFFADDSFHQSAQGHADMARRVKEIVDRVGVPKNPRMGKFNDEDHCYNWLQTGVIPDKGLTYSNSFQMLQMPNTEKYTLELSDDAEQGWINVVNPVDHPMRLFVAYMTTSPAPYVYPLAEAWMESNVRVQLEPAALNYPDKEVHVPRLVDMGLVNPGDSRVFFRTLEKAERPFRLVQVILTIDSHAESESLAGGNWLEEGKYLNFL